MRTRITNSRAFRPLAALAVSGAGLAALATAQTGLVDVNSLLRLLDAYDLNPLF